MVKRRDRVLKVKRCGPVIKVKRRSRVLKVKRCGPVIKVKRRGPEIKVKAESVYLVCLLIIVTR